MPIYNFRFLLVSFFFGVLSGGFLSGDTVDNVAKTRANMLEVLKIRETMATEKRAWREQKDLMEGQLQLDRQALSLLEVYLAESEPQLESLLEESTSLKADLEDYTEVIEFWTGKLEVLKERLAILVSRFPPGLKNQLMLELRDLQALDISRDNALLKRAFDMCLEIISEANEYHRDIHLITEVHALPDGRRGDFKVVYLGLSGGYYFSDPLKMAGRIIWDGETWQWEQDNALLIDLVSLGGIISGQESPRYLALPFQAKEVSP
ncbi:MAG: DUF3450 family protein [Verrucomicrobia bacterium]|nr:DUF3450 family protein [Verrucomicrobiota bacterium]